MAKECLFNIVVDECADSSAIETATIKLHFDLDANLAENNQLALMDYTYAINEGMLSFIS